MKTDEIELTDWMRILFGEVPPAFFIEVVIRTAFIFLLLVATMRIMGKRMAAQITRIELVALFSLAAAIGVPLQAPDRGILPSLVIAIVVVGIGKIIASMVFRNQKFEARVVDRLTIMINDGVFDMKKIKGTNLTTERLCATLRAEGIRHMGEVKRLYFQSNGSFSLVKEKKPIPGLCILPRMDALFCNEQQPSEEVVCSTCGNNYSSGNLKNCSNCGEDKWEKAIL